jgi:FAD synthetase
MLKVMVFGTFDIVHPGHIHMLKEAKSYGDYLIVVVSRDEITRQVKGKAPMLDENTRLEHVKQLNIANKVRLGNLGEDRYQAIREEQPDIIALGYDQVAFVDKLKKNIKDSIKVVRLQPFQPEIYKSSKIKEKMENQD